MIQQDQADKLRKVIQEEHESGIEVTSSLPPRSEYHKNKKKNQIKIQYPIIKFLVLLFLMLPIILGLYYFYFFLNSDVKPVMNNQKSDYFEQVEFE